MTLSIKTTGSAQWAIGLQMLLLPVSAIFYFFYHYVISYMRPDEWGQHPNLASISNSWRCSLMQAMVGRPKMARGQWNFERKSNHNSNYNWCTVVVQPLILLVRHRISIICWCIWWKIFFPFWKNLSEQLIIDAYIKYWSCLCPVISRCHYQSQYDGSFLLSTSIRKWDLHILWEQKHAHLDTNCSDSNHHRSIWRLCISWHQLRYARSLAS